MILDPVKESEKLPEIERGPSKLPGTSHPYIPARLSHLMQNTGFHGGPRARRKGLKLAAWCLLASVIDGLLLTSLSSLLFLCASLVASWHWNSQSLFFFAVVFVSTTWSYMVLTRGFLGMTVGEWTCDLRLGQPRERLEIQYVLKVAIRTTLVLLTGFIPLPLLSLIFGVDLAGKLTGLKLFSLK